MPWLLFPLLPHYFNHYFHCCTTILVVGSLHYSLPCLLLCYFITLFIALLSCLLGLPSCLVAFMPFYHDALLSIWGTFLPPPHLLFFHCLVILCLVASLPCALCVNRYFPFSFFCRWKSLEFGGTSFNQRKIRRFFQFSRFFLFTFLLRLFLF